MGKFTYKARDEKGSLVTGVLEGDNKRAACLQIDALGLFPVSVSETKERTFSFKISWLASGVFVTMTSFFLPASFKR